MICDICLKKINNKNFIIVKGKKKEWRICENCQEKKVVTKYTGQVSKPIYRKIYMNNCSWSEEITAEGRENDQ